MNTVLEFGIVFLGQQRRIVGQSTTQSLDPIALVAVEIRQHEMMDERLIAGMTNPEPHAAIIIAAQGRDRAQAIVPGIAATRLNTHLAARQIEFVMKHDDIRERNLDRKSVV